MADDYSADIAAIGQIGAVSSILDVVCRTTGMGFAAVARVTTDRWIACAVKDEIEFGLKPGGELEISTTICNEIRDSGEAVVIDHVEMEEAWCKHHTPLQYGFQSYISMPIVRGDGSFFGTLCAIDPKPHRLNTPETVAMFRLFADLIAQHLDAGERLASAEMARVMLRDLTDTLEQRVAERTAELRQAEDTLRQAQKMEAVGQLTGGVAHDFNNLLTVISSSAELLRRADLKPERRERYLNAITETVDRAAKLTAQLLAFARRQPLQPQTFDAAQALLGDRNMLNTLVGSGVALSIETSGAPAWVHADPNQLDTAIINMVANARDSMRGSGRIEIEVRSAECIPAHRGAPAQPGRCVAISISDTGDGVAPEAMDQIFEPFYTTKAIGEGTGLGLSQVFGFTKQSGGEVHVESVLGQGATFTLYLPGAEAPPASVSEPVATARSETYDGRVLVVEDNAEIGAFAAQALAELGYETVCTNSPEEALSWVREANRPFDVVFSDVVMPGMSGIDLAQAIRLERPDLPIVLTTGYSEVIARDGAAGFELLRKPYSIEQLARTLNEARAVR